MERGDIDGRTMASQRPDQAATQAVIRKYCPARTHDGSNQRQQQQAPRSPLSQRNPNTKAATTTSNPSPTKPGRARRRLPEPRPQQHQQHQQQRGEGSLTEPCTPPRVAALDDEDFAMSPITPPSSYAATPATRGASARRRSRADTDPSSSPVSTRRAVSRRRSSAACPSTLGASGAEAAPWLEAVFARYCALAGGAQSPRGAALLDGIRWVKFCKEHKLLRRGFGTTEADLVFIRAKGRAARKMTYVQFLTALELVAGALSFTSVAELHDALRATVDSSREPQPQSRPRRRLPSVDRQAPAARGVTTVVVQPAPQPSDASPQEAARPAKVGTPSPTPAPVTPPAAPVVSPQQPLEVSLSTTFQDDVAAMEDARLAAVRQIIAAELGFVADLRTCLDVFHAPLRKKNWVTEKGLNAIFPGQLGDLARKHAKWAAQLEARGAAGTPFHGLFGDVVSQLNDESNDTQGGEGRLNVLAVYKVYAHTFPVAVEALRHWKQQSHRLAAFLRDCLRSSPSELEDLLCSPIKRLATLGAQLRDLARYTPEGHPDRYQVLQTLKQVKGVTSDLSEALSSRSKLQRRLSQSSEVSASATDDTASWSSHQSAPVMSQRRASTPSQGLVSLRTHGTPIHRTGSHESVLPDHAALGTPVQLGGPHPGAPNGTRRPSWAWSRQRDPRGSRARPLRKADIGGPTEFSHINHIGQEAMRFQAMTSTLQDDRATPTRLHHRTISFSSLKKPMKRIFSSPRLRSGSTGGGGGGRRGRSGSVSAADGSEHPTISRPTHFMHLDHISPLEAGGEAVSARSMNLSLIKAASSPAGLSPRSAAAGSASPALPAHLSESDSGIVSGEEDHSATGSLVDLYV